MADETQSEALLQVAMQELQAFERKYAQISKFKALFSEINRLTHKNAPARVPVRRE